MYQQQEVENGIRLLNKVDPGWQKRVNFDTLEMAHYDLCVLGQAYGGYGEGLDKLDIRGRAEEFGFAVPRVQLPPLCTFNEYFTLNTKLGETWKQLVKQEVLA